MNLNIENYHSAEANAEYMSNSQYGNFMDCPAQAVAKLAGYDSAPKACFEVGGYIDINLLTPEEYPAWFARHHGALVETGCLSKRDSTKKNAPLVLADQMIARAKADPVFMQYLVGDHQKMYTFEFGGVMWRGALDVFNLDLKRIVDLKSTKSIVDMEWTDFRTIYDTIEENTPFNHKVPYYVLRGYWRQLALYRYAVEYNEGFVPECFIAAISKEKVTDIDVIQFDIEEEFQRELNDIKMNLPDVMAWKSGEKVAPRCGRCGFCRETKVLGLPSVAIGKVSK